MLHREGILVTQFVPQPKLVGRKGHDKLMIHTTQGLFKGRNGAHQDRLATQHEELLGNLCPKPRPTAASHYDHYRLHLSHLI